MHQSFVSSAPPGLGNSGALNFSNFKALQFLQLTKITVHVIVHVSLCGEFFMFFCNTGNL